MSETDSEYYSQIPVFQTTEDNQKIVIKTKSKSVKYQTRIEHQKESRYRLLCKNYRHFDSDWGRSEYNDGYDSDSDHSCNSQDSTSSSQQQITTSDVLTIFSFHPSQQTESMLMMAISRVFVIIEEQSDDIYTVGDNLFSVQKLNQMADIICSETIGHSLQINLLKMLIELTQQLSREWTQNLIQSSLIQRLISIVFTGKHVLVEDSLQLILCSLEVTHSMPLLIHVISYRFIEAVIFRMDQLKCKTVKANSSDLKANRRQSITQTNMSLVAKQLFRLFSRSVLRLLAIEMTVNQKTEMLVRLTPLLNRFLSCADENVIPNAIRALLMLAENSDQSVVVLIVDSFGKKLMTLSQKNDNRIVSPVLQLFHKVLTSCTPVIAHNDFGIELNKCFERLLADKKDETMTKDIIDIIDVIVKSYSLFYPSMAQMFNSFLKHLLVIFESNTGFIKMSAITLFLRLLCKYGFPQLATLLTIIDLKDIITRLLLNSEPSFQETGFKFVFNILKLLSSYSLNFPKESEQIKQLLFGQQSDVYLCLSKLSYKQCLSESLAKTATDLLTIINSPFDLMDK